MSAVLAHYKKEIDRRDYFYDFSDDPRVSQAGRAHDALRRTLYAQLTQDEKVQAALYAFQKAPPEYQEVMRTLTPETFRG